jgi:hypothetical protein
VGETPLSVTLLFASNAGKWPCTNEPREVAATPLGPDVPVKSWPFKRNCYVDARSVAGSIPTAANPVSTPPLAPLTAASIPRIQICIFVM